VAVCALLDLVNKELDGGRYMQSYYGDCGVFEITYW
jgi:hypothetical protein